MSKIPSYASVNQMEAARVEGPRAVAILGKGLIIGAVLILAAMASAVISVTVLIDRQTAAGDVINIAGRQRMLSERILSNAEQALNDSSPGVRLLRAQALIDSANALEFGHALLNGTKSDRRFKALFTPDLASVYASPPFALDNGMGRLIRLTRDLAEQLTTGAEKADITTSVTQLRSIVPQNVMPGLEAATAGYASSIRDQLLRLEFTVLALSGTTAAFAFLFGLVVIRPSMASLNLTMAQLQRLSDIINHASEAVIVTDTKGRTIWCNDAIRTLSGYSQTELIGLSPGKVLQGPETDPATVAFMAERLRELKPFTCEILNYTKSKEPYWVRLGVTPRYDTLGRVSEFVAVETDITAQRKMEISLRESNELLSEANEELRVQSEQIAETMNELEVYASQLEQEVKRREALERELQAQARTDPLTRLANRRAFFEVSEREIARLRRSPMEKPLGVLMFDVDHFKRINDKYGHPAGDQVLQEVARRCGAQLRLDIDQLARIGGEEFAVLVPQVSLSEILSTAERLRVALSEMPIRTSDGHSILVTASFGIGFVRRDEETIEGALMRADQALYRAKENGRNRIEAEEAEITW